MIYKVAKSDDAVWRKLSPRQRLPYALAIGLWVGMIAVVSFGVRIKNVEAQILGIVFAGASSYLVALNVISYAVKRFEKKEK